MPRPAWDLFPLDEYWRYADFYGVHRGRSMLVLATRGCPYRCSFCSSPQMWTTRYVVRDPEDVADEIADYVNDFGVKNINFADLTAITKRKWTLQFCDALDQRVSGITWQLPVGTRAEALDAEVLQRLWDTGCRNITYAPEAGGERMLEIYNKKVKLDHILTSLREAKRIGIVTRVNIIIGHPEERWSDTWRSLTWLVKAALAGCDDSAVMIFGPYPGSADFKALVDSGRIVVDETFHYVGLARVSSSAEPANGTTIQNAAYIITPARPASAVPLANTSVNMRGTSWPRQSTMSGWFSAAWIIRPMRVRVSASQIAPNIAAEISSMNAR